MTNRRIVTGIMLALIAWGIYLAVGATGYFVETSLTDARKSLIVAVCVVAFLGLWAYVLRAEKNRTPIQPASGQTRSPDAPSPGFKPKPEPVWSRPGICSITMGLLAIVMWLVAVSSFNEVSKVTTTVLGWSVAGLVTGAATAGIIALANPRKLKGKWMGVCGLVQFLLALVVFFIRMTP